MKRKPGFIRKAAATATLTGLAALLPGGCAKDEDPASMPPIIPGATVSDSTRQELEESLFEHNGTLTKNQDSHLFQDSAMTEFNPDSQSKFGKSTAFGGSDLGDFGGDSGLGDYTGTEISDIREMDVNPPIVQVIQTLDFGALTPKFIKDDLGNLGVFLYAPHDEVLYTMKWNFIDSITSRVDVDGNLIDLLQEELNIGGKNYRITKAKTQWMGGEVDEVQLELMAGKATAELNVGSTVTLGIDGVDYTVTLVSTNSTANGYTAKWQVNGEITDSLSIGNIDILVNGQFIGTANASSTSATFSLGTQKLSIKDTNIHDADFSGTVSGDGIFGAFPEDTDAKARIKASLSQDGSTIALDSIDYQLLANTQTDKDVFVSAAHALSESLDYPGASLIDVDFNGLKAKKDGGSGNLVNRLYSSMAFTRAGAGRYMISFTSREGLAYSGVDFVENIEISATERALQQKLVMTEGTSNNDKNISAGTQFVLTGPSNFTHILAYDSWDNTAGNEKLTFTDKATGPYECTYDPATGKANIVRGGDTFELFVDKSTGNLAIDQNGDGRIDGSSAAIADKYGARISILSSSQNSITAGVSTSADRIDGSSVDEVVDLEFDISGTGIILDTPSVPAMYNGSGVQKGQSRYGVLCTWDELTGKMDMKYPEIQEEPAVVVKERN